MKADGIGARVPRKEDPLPHRQWAIHRRHHAAASELCGLCAFYMRMPPSTASTARRRRRCPACWRSSPARTSRATGIGGLPAAG